MTDGARRTPAKKTAAKATATRKTTAGRKTGTAKKAAPASRTSAARKAAPAKKATAAPLPPPPVPAAPVVAAAPPPAAPPPAPAPSAPAAAPDAAPNRWDPPTVVTLAGAAVVLIGSLLPWARAVTVFGTVDVNGTDGDGVLTIICAVVIGLTALGARSRRWVRVLLLLAALLAVFVGIYDLADISHVTGNQYARISAGPGIWLVAIAALVTLGGAIRLLTAGRRSD